MHYNNMDNCIVVLIFKMYVYYGQLNHCGQFFS